MIINTKRGASLLIISTLSLTILVGVTTSQITYDPIYDVNGDGYIGIDDIVAVAEHFSSSGAPINLTQLLDEVNNLKARVTDLENQSFFEGFDDLIDDGWRKNDDNWVVQYPFGPWDGEYRGSAGLSIFEGGSLTGCIIEASVRLSSSSFTDGSGIIFRFINEAHYYFFYISDNTNGIYLSKISTSDPTDLGDMINSTVYAIEQTYTYRLRVIAQDATFTCSLLDGPHGDVTFTGTDAILYYAEGNVGFRVVSATAIFDDLTVVELP
ncbi:MAG: hypothetical protein JSV05_02990 [Candidatus Bathyarchaeota archaeon]|nr:MAG: hypothetical protein JSV05_02990 [Candidatus Bathyarchaeota archaeon]